MNALKKNRRITAINLITNQINELKEIILKKDTNSDYSNYIKLKYGDNTKRIEKLISLKEQDLSILKSRV